MEMKDLRKYMETTLGRLTPAKAQEMARSLGAEGAKGREQVQRVAQELLEWSKTNRDRMTEMIRREVREQLRSMGVATRDEIDALKKRVRELERGGKAPAKTASKRAPAKRAAPKRATAPGARGGETSGS
jgi:polyhydroxyalkanoate synthesis regulator phasin